MPQHKFSHKMATAEARSAVAIAREKLKSGAYDAARETIDELGKSPSQVRRHRLKTSPTSSLERPVFICGLHRSGTTLLHDYLAAHYDLSVIRNAKVPENEGQFLQDAYVAERPFGGPGSFAFYPQMSSAAPEDPSEAQALGKKLLSQWDSWTEGSSSVLLEKSPPNIVRIAYLRALFPNARFIVWSRDPRAVSLATQKWHDLPVSQLMMHWNTAYMKAFEDLGPDCILASYEAFCEDPAGTTARLAEFCDLPPRATPLDMGGRFAAVNNSNEKYLSQFPADYQIRNRIKAWEIFGYDLPAGARPAKEGTPAQKEPKMAKPPQTLKAGNKKSDRNPGNKRAKQAAEAALMRPIVVQIGFNKCATLSLTRMFNRSGVRSLHCNWSRGLNRQAGKAKKARYQARIHDNLAAGRPAFEGFDKFSGFFDLELIRMKRHCENFKHFAAISETYPNAKFILNTRDKAKWLRSRARHSNGLYLEKYMSLYKESEEQVFARWAADFDSHHAAVRQYFADQPDRLVDFEISTDPIATIVDFVAPNFTLDPSHWGHAHKTNDKSWATEAQDRWADYDFTAFCTENAT